MIETHRLPTVPTRIHAGWFSAAAVSAKPVVSEGHSVQNANPDHGVSPGQFSVGIDTRVLAVGGANGGCTDWTGPGPANRGDRRVGH